MIEMLNDKIVNNNILIFDLDGTIVNTDRANFLAYQEAVKEIKKIDLSSLYSKNERFTRNKLKEILPMLNTQEWNEIIKMKNTIYGNYLQETSIDTLALNIINNFTKTNKIILATNSHKERADLVLKYHHLDDIFDFKFYKNDYKDYLKIDPKLTIVFENENFEVQQAELAEIPDKNIFNLQFKRGDDFGKI
ncbi:MAG: HAD hydrolase-like protein [Campylobacterales bacterium]|nr:HAD hydrolase-like protein [Campylobacterales bacterium]